MANLINTILFYFQAELEELNQNEGPEIEEARTTLAEIENQFTKSEEA